MVGNSTFDFKYKKKDKAITIKVNDCVNIKDSVVDVDPQLFFQRWIVSIQPDKDAFSYELCTRPSSLFDKKGLMNEAHKPALKSALFDQPGLSECIIPHFLQNTYPLYSWWLVIVPKTSMDCWKHVWWNMLLLQKLFAEQLQDSWKHNSHIWRLLAFFYKGQYTYLTK